MNVLNVFDVALPIPLSASEEASFRDENVKHGREVVRRAEQVLNTASYKVQTAVEEGNPKSKIIDEAVQWNAELIVVGSHGRKGINRLLMWSVAEAVARHAPCSVQIVRMPVEAPTHLAVSSNESGRDVGNPEGKIQTPIALEPEQDKQICKVCGKPSGSVICPACADKIRAEAVARKKREDKGEE